MAKGIIGKKIGMTQVFSENGAVIPVTVVQAGPCVIVQKKTVESDGYNAIQIGFEEILHENKVNKPMAGHFKKADVKPMKYLREIRVDNIDDYTVGQEINTTIFEENELVDIQGVSIGKGFAGVMKRWNFAGGPAGHGSGFHRRPGSIGMKEWPAEVDKGKKMPGHLGVEKITTQRLKVVKVMPEKNVLLIRGSVPGHKNGIIYIKGTAKPKR